MILCFVSFFINTIVISIIGLILFVIGLVCIAGSLEIGNLNISIQEFFIKEPRAHKYSKGGQIEQSTNKKQ
jgi:hypothetical protein